MTIYSSLLHWIIPYCLLLSLSLDPHLLFKCRPCFLFSVSTSQKLSGLYPNIREFYQISSGKSGNYQGILFRHLTGNPVQLLGNNVICYILNAQPLAQPFTGKGHLHPSHSVHPILLFCWVRRRGGINFLPSYQKRGVA